jgi:hypothetical protein
MVESKCITRRSSIDQRAARYIRTLPNPNQNIAAIQVAKMPRRNHAAKSHQVIVGAANTCPKCSGIDLLPRPKVKSAMGFNKRRMESERAAAAAKEAAARRALGPQIIEDSVKLVEIWNARRAAHIPMLFSPTIEAAITAGYWFLRARCPACRTTGDVDLRTLDWHHGAAVTALTSALSYRSCRPNAPFAELVCLSKSSVAEQYYAERSGNKWINE